MVCLCIVFFLFSNNFAGYVCLKVETNYRYFSLSVSWRIFLTLCRCTLTRKKFFLSESFFKTDATPHTDWNIFNSLMNNIKTFSVVMSKESWLQNVRTNLWKQLSPMFLKNFLTCWEKHSFTTWVMVQNSIDTPHFSLFG